MTNKMILGGGILTVVAFFILFTANIPSKTENSLLLQNVEALAKDESAGDEKCSIIKHTEVWDGDCLYRAVYCAEGYYLLLNLIYCIGR